ncbi:DUF1275 domain containing protein [Nitzschia inconspicua]|uniref:DUF1275 domain containing protein n=1 Tax=Nitzschia inconspicua TaxID=303405 RepID=A0A9K3L4P7_9STRA|nr:DUF1275 domain containing protein [Nitzschia inconspicua]
MRESVDGTEDTGRTEWGNKNEAAESGKVSVRNENTTPSQPIRRAVTQRLRQSMSISFSSVDTDHCLVEEKGLRRQQSNVCTQLDEEFQHVFDELPEDLNDHTPAVRVSPMNAKYLDSIRMKDSVDCTEDTGRTEWGNKNEAAESRKVSVRNENTTPSQPIRRAVTQRLRQSMSISFSSVDNDHCLVEEKGLRRQQSNVCTQLDEEFQHVFDELPEDLNDHTPAVRVSPMNAKYSYREHNFIVFLGTVLSFSSGFSNGISLSGLLLTDYTDIIDRQSTSGMTGVYTLSALALANSNYDDTGNLNQSRFVGFQISIILSYMMGSCISAVLNPRPAPWRLAPMYVHAFLIGAIFMCIAAALAAGERYFLFQVPYFFHFVAAANGVQNAVSSMYSANLIRTTHLTGTTTDIGLLIGQLLRGNTTNTWKLPILLSLAISFWFGGLISFFAVQQWKEFTLLVNAGIFLVMFFSMLVFMVNNLHIPLHRALRGAWHWQRTMRKLEFRSSRGGQPQTDETLHAIFARLDRDCDGFIALDDLYEGLHEMGMTDISRADVESMFLVGSSNLQGQMTEQEFRDLIKGENIVVG